MGKPEEDRRHRLRQIVESLRDLQPDEWANIDRLAGQIAWKHGCTSKTAYTYILDLILAGIVEQDELSKGIRLVKE